MKKERLEAFSDGVLAIIITIMVLELRPPDGITFQDLRSQVPTFLGYAVSFAYLGMCWVNHYELIQRSKIVTGRVLWSNLLWLFLTSLIPFATAWASQSGFSKEPTALYSAVLTAGALSYHLLIHSVDRLKKRNVGYFEILKRDRRSRLTILMSALSIGTAFILPILSYIIIGALAASWIIPAACKKEEGK